MSDAKPKKPQRSGTLKRRQIYHFIDACNNLASLPETIVELRQAFQRGGEAAINEQSVKNQRRMLEMTGVEAGFGVSQLNKIGTNFPNDPEMQQKMQSLQMFAVNSCQRAKLSPAEEGNFLRRQQEAMRQRQQQQQQQQQRMIQVQKAVSVSWMVEWGSSSIKKKKKMCVWGGVGLFCLLTSP